MGVSRRQLVVGIGAGLLWPYRTPGAEPWDPFADPPQAYPRYWKKILFRSDRLNRKINQLLTRYENRKAYRNRRLMDALIFLLYAYWRTFEKREDRSKAAQLLYRLGQKFSQRAPDLPEGFMAQTIALGLEGMVIGILDALNLLPGYRRNLKRAVELDPSYHWGLPYSMLGVLYAKAPPFPLAMGDLGKAEKYFRKAEKLAKGRSAIWYLFYGEFLYIKTGDIHQVENMRRRMHQEMDPPDAYEYYIYDLSENDFAKLIETIRAGKYDRYLYTPLLPKAQPGGV